MDTNNNRMVSSFWHHKKILVTGGLGFLGQHILKTLWRRGVAKKQVRVPEKGFDLRLPANCKKISEGMDIVIHAAGLVGGIGFARMHPGKIFYDNAAMGIHMLEAARETAVQKFVGIGSVCEYPEYAPLPFREEDVWNGYPEEVMAPYGIAKRMMLEQGKAYRKEYGLNVIHLLQINLYGPGDTFEPGRSHVIAALIKKFIDARRANEHRVVAWGTGTPTREFLYVADAAEGIVSAAERYDGKEPINLGSGEEISVAELATLIAKLVGGNFEIVFDSSMPDGQPRRKLDTSKAERYFGFKARTPLAQGLAATIGWYRAQHPGTGN